jgi:hypothetical protein
MRRTRMALEGNDGRIKPAAGSAIAWANLLEDELGKDMAALIAIGALVKLLRRKGWSLDDVRAVTIDEAGKRICKEIKGGEEDDGRSEGTGSGEAGDQGDRDGGEIKWRFH